MESVLQQDWPHVRVTLINDQDIKIKQKRITHSNNEKLHERNEAVCL